jgi:DinB superfamily
MNASDILKYGQGTVLQAIEELSEKAWDTPGACGVWSIKDIIAHLTSYEHVILDVLSTFVSSDPTPYLSKYTEPGGGFNDSEVAARKGKTVKEVLGEFHDTHEQVMALAARMPVETFRQAGTLPWYGMEYALDDFIVYTQYGHKREHSAQIAAFRDHLTA